MWFFVGGGLFLWGFFPPHVFQVILKIPLAQVSWELLMAGWSTVQGSVLHVIPLAPLLGYRNIA